MYCSSCSHFSPQKTCNIIWPNDYKDSRGSLLNGIYVDSDKELVIFKFDRLIKIMAGPIKVWDEKHEYRLLTTYQISQDGSQHCYLYYKKVESKNRENI